MKSALHLLLLLTAVGFGVLSPVHQARAQTKETSFFDKEYRHGDKYVPKWTSYVGGDKVEYEIGFNAGLTLAITKFPDMGTDALLRNAVAANEKRPVAYRMGFTAALEVYSAYQAFTKPPGA